MIVVHGIPGSPYVRSVLLGLEEKRLPWRLAAMGMGEHRTDSHRRRHPFARIPVIEHDGFMLYETQAILRYLDTLGDAPSLRPADSRQAARMDQVVGIVDCYASHDISGAISFPRLIGPMIGQVPDEPAIAAALPGARICVAELERLRGGSAFMAGDRVSIADLMLVPHVDCFEMTPEGAALLSGTTMLEWLATMRARGSMQATAYERLMQAA